MVAKNNKNTESKKWFFGWTNIKFILKELILIYSTKSSFFSKKRIESGLAFIIAQWGMIFFLIMKYQDLTMGEFLLWAAAEFTVSGYIIHKIEKSKGSNVDSGEES